ncbi:mitochondrial outer membrane translocase complex, subunit Tom20 domain-containing protein [Schizophyllum amplum]|uniref:Mitochondrial outer membrane translocase complex, subunit Tom20 domain-containing protein n=1 Tax=Schizophyllum amplum TaxID=97359 RepID=A0A550CST9_9AGAR|nr:mitochondrial outer membrane translocase complex, subunit Tom20 domain-containing protein [Auriculariopsis ampla]
MSSRSTSATTIAGITLLSGLVAYAVYFDYKRRNDANFRRKLRKDKKRVDKVVAESMPPPITKEVILETLERAKQEPAPASPEMREPYFMEQISKGEKLSLLGPELHLEAALSFYKGLQVYPSPMELIVIYQKTVPEPIFKIITQMMDLDVSQNPLGMGMAMGMGMGMGSGIDLGMDLGINLDELEAASASAPTSSGPPSETSSQDWDKVTDPASS